MEGLKPPPRAEYNFPNNPDLNKFWGTPLSRAFFRSMAVVFSLSALIWGSNLYFLRNEKGPFGLDFSMTQKEFEVSRDIRSQKTFLMSRDLALVAKSDQIFVDRQMKFDDGVQFRPR